MNTEYIVSAIISIIISYLLGSINSSITVIRIWKKVDIREYGSKNAGLTNTLRVFGNGQALVTLLCDLAKGVAAVLLCRLIAYLIGVDNTLVIGYVAGVAAVFGHIYPVFYGFKGGKGVLVAATTLLALDPLTFSIVIPFFALILYITRYVSVSSILAAIAYPITNYFTQSIRGIEMPLVNSLFALIICVMIIYKHKPNIERLINHTENKFSFHKK